MGLKRVSWVRRYQGQCRALRPLGHQGYRLRNYKKDPPLCSGYNSLPPWAPQWGEHRTIRERSKATLVRKFPGSLNLGFL